MGALNMSPSKSNISIIILAAGASKRLGIPKQLLPYKGTTLLRHIVQIATASKAENVFVVVGSQADDMKSQFFKTSVTPIYNADWNEGMGSSIRRGVQSVPPHTEAVVILVCDQPQVTTNLLDTIIDAYVRTKKPVIACRYGETVGVPALFDRSLFAELEQLRGDRGAKSIIDLHASERMVIDFPEGVIDIDTDEDYKRITGTSPFVA
jgi:molybdenum cofactor cytidylyltransferase